MPPTAVSISTSNLRIKDVTYHDPASHGTHQSQCASRQGQAANATSERHRHQPHNNPPPRYANHHHEPPVRYRLVLRGRSTFFLPLHTEVHVHTSTGATLDNVPPVLQQWITPPHLLHPPAFGHLTSDKGPLGSLLPNKESAGTNLNTLLTRMKDRFGDFTPIKANEFEAKLHSQIQQTMQDLDAQFIGLLRQLETTNNNKDKPLAPLW